MSIKVLAPEVIARIAAGEVVERPASVVKELVENSLDAGARRIDIEVQGGGVGLIRVVDNGGGIPSGEVKLAFQRYATSKLNASADLTGIVTLGFRGEALPSIAAVAQVEMLTRSEGEMAGSYISLRDGVVGGVGRRARVVGTTLTVRHLFRSVPARLKFLKSLSTENSHISHLVSRFGLAFPEVRFSLSIDGRSVLHTPGNGDLRDSLAQVYSLNVAQAMLEVGNGGEEVGPFSPRVSGMASPPSICRTSSSQINLFINRRWVRSRGLARAVEEAYRGLVMEGRHPIAVIQVALHPREIDVNVHPAKMEVRFRHEGEVFGWVYRAVRRSLTELIPIPHIKPWPEIGLSKQTSGKTYQAGLSFVPPSPPTTQETHRGLPVLRLLGQLASAYIVAEGSDGLYLIDQHAAHERILFEKVLSRRTGGAVEVQGMLEPLAIEVGAGEEEILRSRVGSLTEFGFDIELFGPRTFLVRTVPAMLEGRDVPQVVRETLDILADGGSTDWVEKLAASLACHSAVRAGQPLSDEEMRGLVRQLEEVKLPRSCPHGRPTMIHLSSSHLEREFGRG